MKKGRSLLLAGILGLGCGIPCWAVDPFDNWANPVGFYGVLYPLHVNSQEKTDKDKNPNPLFNNADLHVTETVLRGVYYGSNWLASIYLPVGKVGLRNNVKGAMENSSGMGDPTFVGGYFFVNDKAANTYAALGLKVDAPWGAYDKTRLANMGNNVWRYRPLLALAKLSMPFDLESTITYDVRQPNKDFQFGGSYDPGDALEIETYAGMFVSPQLMPGIHLNYATGGNDRWDTGAGFKSLDGSSVQTFQYGLSLLWLPTQKFNVMFQAIQDATPKNAFKQTLFLSRIAYKFT